MFCVYILHSKKSNKYYSGCTNHLERRLAEHNAGKNFSTISGRPWELVCYREFNDQKEAFVCEKLVKSYKGGNAFKKIVNQENESWKRPII